MVQMVQSAAIKKMSTIYYYSYGDDLVLGSIIHVIRLRYDLFKIMFEQVGFDTSHFKNIESDFTVIQKNIHDFYENPHKRIICLYVETIFNNPPEKLFRVA